MSSLLRQPRQVLEELMAQDCKVPALIMEYRKLKKFEEFVAALQWRARSSTDIVLVAPSSAFSSAVPCLMPLQWPLRGLCPVKFQEMSCGSTWACACGGRAGAVCVSDTSILDFTLLDTTRSTFSWVCLDCSGASIACLRRLCVM